MENIEELLKCNCGSVFFDEIRAKTYIENQFIFHASTPSAKLSSEDTTIPVAKCLFCGKVYLPRTSFAGRNTLDRSVQVYAELTSQWNDNQPQLINAAEITGTLVESKDVKDVETKSGSVSDTKDVIQAGKQRNRPIKDNKK